jgi:hypothetical protein
MKRLSVGLLALAAAAVFTMSAVSQPPEGGDGKDRPRGGDRRGPGGPGIPGRFAPKVIPPMVRDDLQLSEEQSKMVDELEKDVKERLSKILTGDQKKKLESFRPHGFAFPGGPGGPRDGRGRDGPPSRDGDRPRPPRDEPPPDEDQVKADAAIQWIPTWTAGRAEAVRTGRPILLVSAAPHCAGVSGIW